MILRSLYVPVKSYDGMINAFNKAVSVLGKE